MAELLNLEGLTKETIAEYISDLDDDQLVRLWNDTCDHLQWEDRVYAMDEENLESILPDDKMELVRLLHNSNFNLNDNYFTFRGDGSLESFSQLQSGDNSPLYQNSVEEMVGYVYEMECDVGDTLYGEIESEVEDKISEAVEEWLRKQDFDDLLELAVKYEVIEEDDVEGFDRTFIDDLRTSVGDYARENFDDVIEAHVFRG